MRNYIVILFVALISSSAISNELPVTTRVSASLNDGSIIKAEAITENISGRTLFANNPQVLRHLDTVFRQHQR